jgi:hypothetical protein
MTDAGRIFFANDRGELRQLRIIDAAGKTILETTTRDEVFAIDVSNLPAGVYPFTIESENGTIITNGKVVISR